MEKERRMGVIVAPIPTIHTMRSLWLTVLVIIGIFSYLPIVTAFGAGEIPDYAIIKG